MTDAKPVRGHVFAGRGHAVNEGRARAIRAAAETGSDRLAGIPRPRPVAIAAGQAP